MDALDVEVEALRDSGAYREGAKLDDLRAQARRLREHAERADRVAAESVVARDEAAQQLAETGADRDMAVANRGARYGGPPPVGGARRRRRRRLRR